MSKIAKLFGWKLNDAMRWAGHDDLEVIDDAADELAGAADDPRARLNGVWDQLPRGVQDAVADLVESIASSTDPERTVIAERVPSHQDPRVTYKGTRDICEEPPPVREPSAQERAIRPLRSVEAPENDPSST